MRFTAHWQGTVSGSIRINTLGSIKKFMFARKPSILIKAPQKNKDNWCADQRWHNVSSLSLVRNYES